MFIQKGKTNWILIIIVAFVAGAVSGGLVAYINDTVKQTSVLLQIAELKKPKKTQNIPINQETLQNNVSNETAAVPSETVIDQSAPQSTQSANSTETSTWQTYRNEKYSFELKYPSAWKFENKMSLAVPEIDLTSNDLYSYNPENPAVVPEPAVEIKIAMVKKDEGLKSTIAGSRNLGGSTVTITQPGNKLTIFENNKCLAPELAHGTSGFYNYNLATDLMSDPAYYSSLVDTNNNYVFIVDKAIWVNMDIDEITKILDSLRPVAPLEFVKTNCQ